MANQYSTCSICGGKLIKNGENSSGRSRWRCKECGTSVTLTNDTAVQSGRFRLFMSWILSTQSLTSVAARKNTSRRQLARWFNAFWLVQVPHNIDPDRVFDQIFIDGTYFGRHNCLLVASSKDHIIAYVIDADTTTRADLTSKPRRRSKI